MWKIAPKSLQGNCCSPVGRQFLLDKNAKSTKLTGIVQGCLRMLILSFRIPRPCARAVVGQNPQNFRQGFYDFLTLKPFQLLYFARQKKINKRQVIDDAKGHNFCLKQRFEKSTLKKLQSIIRESSYDLVLPFICFSYVQPISKNMHPNDMTTIGYES